MSKNVHGVLIILTRRGKFVLPFLDFYLFFYEFFSAECLKKRAPDRAEAQPSGRPSRASPPRARQRRRARVRLGLRRSPAALPLVPNPRPIST